MRPVSRRARRGQAAPPLPVETSAQPGRVLQRKGQGRARTGHKAAPESQWSRRRPPLRVHLLEALTFVPQVEHPVVEEPRPARGMSDRQISKPLGKLIAPRRHRPPPTRDLFQVVLSPHNPHHKLEDRQQLALQPHGGLVERHAKLWRQRRYFLVKLGQR